MPINVGSIRRREEAAAEHVRWVRELVSRVEEALREGQEVRLTVNERKYIGNVLNLLGMTLVDEEDAKKRVHRSRKNVSGLVVAESERSGQLERLMLLNVHTRHRDAADDPYYLNES